MIRLVSLDRRGLGNCDLILKMVTATNASI